MQNTLRVLRAEKRWSQADVADRLGVSRQTVNAVESGKSDPTLLLAFRIAQLFEKPIEDIFTPTAPADPVVEPPVLHTAPLFADIDVSLI